MIQWFKSNGDHFLNQISIFLLGGNATGMLPPGWKYTPFITMGLAMLHTIFVPDQTVVQPKVTVAAK